MSALDSWTAGEHTAPVNGEPTTHSVYRKGEGPGVIVIHEIPGLTEGVIEFAEKVVAAGHTVLLPHLFGPKERPFSLPDVLRTFPRLCVSREFTVLATNETSPVTTWLRSQASEFHHELGGPGIGALGMCFTGGFALAMMIDDATIAPVLCQPSTPMPVGKARSADVNLTPEDLHSVRRRAEAGCSVLGLRYRMDSATGTRFETLTRELGDHFIRVELEGKGHSTVTEHQQPEAIDAVLNFFAERLR